MNKVVIAVADLKDYSIIQLKSARCGLIVTGGNKMGYRRAEEILPQEIIELIQYYVDGENIYIPRKEQRREWGSTTSTRQELKQRNCQIVSDHKCGYNTAALAEKYYLSEKSIQRILRESREESATAS